MRRGSAHVRSFRSGAPGGHSAGSSSEKSAPKPVVPALPAATVTLVRDTHDGLEVLMLQRNHRSGFMPGVFLFPGGALDPDDSSDAVVTRCAGIDDIESSAVLGLPQGGLAYWTAAIRESFEEAGVLLAYDDAGELVNPGEPSRLERFEDYRKRLNAGEACLGEMLEREGLRLAADRLTYFGHWITPVTAPRRYDTRFFVAIAPDGQEALPDNVEAIHHVWVNPAAALDTQPSGWFRHENADHPDAGTIRSARHHRDAHRGASQRAHGPGCPSAHRRRWTCSSARRSRLRNHRGRSRARQMETIVPGIAVTVAPMIVRITAPNPGVMTGPGTNSYIVGKDRLVLVDPGPEIESHISNLADAVRGRLDWIVCTHTHLDHSPAARALKAATGARIAGRLTKQDSRQDSTFEPDRILEDGDTIAVDGVTLRAVHTPGHASNHLCYLFEQQKLIFTGDHIMQGSTVVIGPPDGDMQAYFASLEKLFSLDLATVAPGHGRLITTPHDEVRRLIAHRLKREEKVLGALGRKSPATLDELLPLAYDDVPEKLYPPARRSLHAHLIKLAREGRARECRRTLGRRGVSVASDPCFGKFGGATEQADSGQPASAVIINLRRSC